MTSLPIIDSHVHLWDTGWLRFAWLDGISALNRPFQPEDYRAEAASLNIRKMVFIKCGCDRSQSRARVIWMTELVRTEPRLQGIVVQAALQPGLAVRTELAAFAANPLVKGVRRILQGEADRGFCLHPVFVAGVQALAESGFSCDLCLAHDQLPAVTELVKGSPGVRFVPDHSGKPAIRELRLEPGGSIFARWPSVRTSAASSTASRRKPTSQAGGLHNSRRTSRMCSIVLAGSRCCSAATGRCVCSPPRSRAGRALFASGSLARSRSPSIACSPATPGAFIGTARQETKSLFPSPSQTQ